MDVFRFVSYTVKAWRTEIFQQFSGTAQITWLMMTSMSVTYFETLALYDTDRILSLKDSKQARLCYCFDLKFAIKLLVERDKTSQQFNW